MNERGNASVALLGLTSVIVILILLLADLALFLLARAQAQTAADASALAAAAELLPGGARRPKNQAARLATANGAKLLECTCGSNSDDAYVRVGIDVRLVLIGGTHTAEARARAKIDLENLGKPPT